MRQTNRRIDIRGGENATHAGKESRQNAGECRRRSTFEHIDMRVLVEECGVAGFSMGSYGDLICHGAARHVDRIFLAQKLGCTPLEILDCGIVAIDVITDFGICHCPTHLECGAAARVTTQINHRPRSLMAACIPSIGRRPVRSRI
jgi:hypothetical protein